MEINSRNENIELNNIINNLDLNENNDEIDINIIEENLDVVTETSEYLETEFNVIPMTSESDPIFLSSPAHNITNSDIENWNSKQERLIAGDNIIIENNVISSEASGGTANFDELDNRPKYNNNTMNHLTNIPLVPTKISDLENDSEFITKNVNNLVNYTKSSLLGTLALKNNVDYNNEVINKPTIPTKTSDLINDSGYITEHQDLSNYPTLAGLNIFSNAQKILSNAYAGLSLYYDTDNYVNFGYTGFHYNTNGESGTIDYKDIGGGGDTLPIGAIVDYDGSTVPEGYEEVEDSKTILSKYLSSTASGDRSINWQCLGNLYLDLPAGTWLVIGQFKVITTGNGTANTRICLSNTMTPTGSNKYAFANFNGMPTTATQLSSIITLTETTRVYMLSLYAYSGSNLSIQMQYDSGNTYDGVQPYIKAIKL